MEGVYGNKPVGELVRGPTRATKVGEPEEAPHREEHGGAGGGPMQSKIQKHLETHYSGQKFMCL